MLVREFAVKGVQLLLELFEHLLGLLFQLVPGKLLLGHGLVGNCVPLFYGSIQLTEGVVQMVVFVFAD